MVSAYDLGQAEHAARSIQRNCASAIGELNWYGLGARGNRGYQGNIYTIQTLVDEIFKHLDYCPCCYRKNDEAA